jgi:hypothetical protein
MYPLLDQWAAQWFSHTFGSRFIAGPVFPIFLRGLFAMTMHTAPVARPKNLDARIGTSSIHRKGESEGTISVR